MSSISSHLFVFGSNSVGQSGISFDDYNILEPTEITHISGDQLLKVVTSQNQTYVILTNGVLLTAGENDQNELCRTGKRSWLQRCDCLETFQIVDSAIGSNYSALLNKDGHILSWGVNDMGQLGNTTRETNFKPRVNNAITDSILQIASGIQHSVVLTKSGSVMMYGANKKGQLGNGQLTSSTIASPINSLKHKPIVQISCGENHSMVLTSGGGVFSWGDNSQGQLGLGDLVSRLRPDQVRCMRSVKVVKIATGGQHSLLLASSGMLFSCGSNSHGQCGINDTELRTQSLPVAIERLSDLQTIDMAAGKAHSIVICSTADRSDSYTAELKTKVFVMGLNSSGQLGLGHTQTVFTPTVQPFSLTNNVVKAYSGPLSLHTVVVTGSRAMASSRQLPIVSYEIVRQSVQSYLAVHHKVSEMSDSSAASVSNAAAQQLNQALVSLRETVATAFSSIAILNASFLSDFLVTRKTATSSSNSRLNINLTAVREAYNMILSTEAVTPLVVATLGRATLYLTEHLRECPFDDAENLSVFLVLLENPLMLRPADFHVAIEVVVSCILSIPKYYRVVLFKWLKAYPSEYFGRVLQVLQGFLSFVLTSKTTNLDATSVVLVLETLHQCNVEEDILPAHLFYNSSVTSRVDLLGEWRRWRESGPGSKVFNYWDYSFLISDVVKYQVIQYDMGQLKNIQMYKFVNKYVNPTLRQQEDPSQARLPRGVGVQEDEHGAMHLHAQVTVDRENLVNDLLNGLLATCSDDKDTLKLPLRVSFVGEQGVDRGGVTKELFSLAIPGMIAQTKVLAPTTTGRHLWFTCRESVTPAGFSDEFFLGLLVGLAAYNGVYVDLPLPSFIYKIISGRQLSLSDLWEVEVDLARGLQSLLDYEEGGAVGFEELFGVTFTSSQNPLLPVAATTPLTSAKQVGEKREIDAMRPVSGGENIAEAQQNTVELVPGGADRAVTKLNRVEFVNLYVQHALYGCCEEQIGEYIRGLRFLFDGPAVKLCTHIELEHILCGSREIGDLSELRVRTKYRGAYTDEHPVINWFWDVLSSMSVTHKRKFLQFVTGSERIPLGGICDLGLAIQSTLASPDSLPSSH